MSGDRSRPGPGRAVCSSASGVRSRARQGLYGEKVRAVAGEIREGGREAYPYVVDCSKKEDVYRVAAQVRDEVGDVAVLVNNAAFSPTKNYVSEELSDDFEILFCQRSGSLLGEVGAARREGGIKCS